MLLRNVNSVILIKLATDFTCCNCLKVEYLNIFSFIEDSAVKVRRFLGCGYACLRLSLAGVFESQIIKEALLLL